MGLGRIGAAGIRENPPDFDNQLAQLMRGFLPQAGNVSEEGRISNDNSLQHCETQTTQSKTEIVISVRVSVKFVLTYYLL